MDTMSAIRARRSIRRFTQEPIPQAALLDLLEAARLSPTGMNAQPLQFVAVVKPSLCKAIFPHLKWAAYIPDGSAGPSEETQPTAYVLILVDKRIKPQADTDAGAAAMSMMLAAQAHGVSTCWLGSVRREAVLTLLDIDGECFFLHTVLALGYAAQTSRAVDLEGENTAYYLEAEDHLCVPKRKTSDIISIRS